MPSAGDIPVRGYGGYGTPDLDPRIPFPEPTGQSYGEGYVPLPGREAEYTAWPFDLYKSCVCHAYEADFTPPIDLYPPPNYPVNGKWAARFLGGVGVRFREALKDTAGFRDRQSAAPGLIPMENSYTADLVSPIMFFGRSMGIKRVTGR